MSNFKGQFKKKKFKKDNEVNTNQSENLEIEKNFLSVGKAYIHIYIKSLFIVQFIQCKESKQWKEGKLKICEFFSRISDEG